MSPRPSAFAALVLALAAPRIVHALEAPSDCPPGSSGKVSGAFAFCEPSVCIHDGNCAQGEVCRTVPLCVEVGTLADAGQKGEERLVATQRCGAGGACPSTQTCSTKDRCIARQKAQALGLLDAPPPAASASAAPAAAPEAKKSCGCDAPGADPSSAPALVLAVPVLVAWLRRRRHHV